MSSIDWKYWSLTIPFGVFAVAGLAELILSQHTIASVGALGYPWYVAYIVGFAKLAGGAVILFGNKFTTLKEWAYAGFFIEFSGALVSHLATGGTREIAILIPVIVLTLVSDRYWKKKRINLAVPT